MEESSSDLPVLSLSEQRVLGSLIEKSKTVPEYYPMTLNALTTACNQKSSRNPVVNFDDETVLHALDTLKKKGLSANVIGGGSRALKYKHHLAVKYPLDPAETSILCLLLLRGPLTPGEIKANAGRLHDFDSISEIQEILTNLMNYETPFVEQLPRRTGQKESRFCHLFAKFEDLNTEIHPEDRKEDESELEERLSRIEQELADLKQDFENLMKQLM